ncbi:MAG TPA: rhomboid family intramembrane serine protease [Chthonomonadaceae bacterium]|nr:rhomboid family intramembrane serine protease [Chthonomonadaceae bacterium]
MAVLVPFRAKNPPERFPIATVSLIALTTLVFLVTSEAFLILRPDVLAQWAVSDVTLAAEPWRLLTAMFLHADIVHLLGNMVFLWVFGGAVEGRLRPAKFLALYLLAGLCGGLLEEVFWGILHPAAFSLGASGAIMGVAGAYLYMFPYSTICIFYMWYFRIGVWEAQARWVVLFYTGLDLLLAFLLKGEDGVGHLAHLGGFGVGLLFCLALRARRDSEDVSVVQAARAELKNYAHLSVRDLETLVQHPTEEMELILSYCQKAASAGHERDETCVALLNRYSRELIAKAEPERLAFVALSFPPTAGALPLVFYLRLASRLESMGSKDLACQVYRRIYDLAPTAPETEKALFRMGQIMEHNLHNRAYAQQVYAEMLRLFPNGEMASQARRALQQLGMIETRG